MTRTKHNHAEDGVQDVTLADRSVHAELTTQEAADPMSSKAKRHQESERAMSELAKQAQDLKLGYD